MTTESQLDRVAVVIATYNERENVQALLPRLLQLDLQPDVVVVDDNSPDGTAAAVLDVSASFPRRVHLISRESKQGYGSAMIEGFSWALESGVDAVVTIDADLSHDPDDVPRLHQVLLDADVAIGSRYCGGIRVMNWGPNRLLLSLGANRYVRFVLGYDLYDSTSGFRAYRSEVLKSIDLTRIRSRGYSFLVELLESAIRGGFSVQEVPIVYTERTTGRSKMSRGVMIEAVFRPWILRLNRIFFSLPHDD